MGIEPLSLKAKKMQIDSGELCFTKKDKGYINQKEFLWDTEI